MIYDNFLPYLQTLVSHPTVTGDTAANERSLDFLQAFFEEHDMYVERFRFNGVGSLIATVKKGDKTPRVMLAAHLDVVSAPAKLFKVREEDGKLFGRGVYDMKSAIATYMCIVNSLGAQLGTYDLGIMITTDEESGSSYGAGKLLELGYRPEVCILPDGGENWNLETQAKGFLFFDIAIAGKTAHGSRPWEGDSASVKLVGFLHELSTFFHEQALNTNTLNISSIETEAGSLTQIPGTAAAKLDIRYLSPKDRLAILRELDRLSKKYDGTLSERDMCGAPCVNNITHPLIAPFVASIRQITGIESSGTLSTGASDARFFARIDVPCILTHPPGGNQHAEDEWISAEGCRQFVEVVMDYLEKIAKV